MLGLVLAAGLFLNLRGPTENVAIGQPIRHDDFLFTVERVTRESRVDGVRYHVAILVQNQALRVDYRWRNDIAYVTDRRGVRYRPTSSGQFVLGPGESRTAGLTFDLPRDARDVKLQFWDGIFMGDALNGGAYANARIVLTPADLTP